MIVTLTGAFRNVGDHLIGDRARKLLREYVDSDIVNINRNNITEDDYDTMNKAKAVILCGGPAYQRHIYPTIYPIDYTRISVPIIPMGLGWKSHPNDTPESFKFESEALKFIEHIHKTVKYSSTRDVLTEQVVKNTNVPNVLMTGCPVWYDLDYMDKDFDYVDTIEQINFSSGARYQPEMPELLGMLSKRYPDAKKYMTFHHGWFSQFNRVGLYQMFHFFKMMLAGLRYGFKPINLSKDINKLKIYDQKNAIHIGYRVHAHLYCLSRRKPSFLINEDVRGAGQSQSLGMVVMMAKDPNLVNILKAQLDGYEASKGGMFEAVQNRMKQTFDVMKDFLEAIK